MSNLSDFSSHLQTILVNTQNAIAIQIIFSRNTAEAIIEEISDIDQVKSKYATLLKAQPTTSVSFREDLKPEQFNKLLLEALKNETQNHLKAVENLKGPEGIIFTKFH